MPNSSPNHLNSAPNTDDQQNEILSDKQHLTRLQNEIGSKVLTLVGFESRNKDIVNSSFEKARKQKEKLPGKNNERRNFAYLSRLDNMIEKHGNALEQKLWAASVENLIIKPEDIEGSYWKQQEQILRDNGQGRELTSSEKEYLTEDIINKQRESINTWSNYLGDKDCPYPTWFKVYAFDGVSKMGLINKETKEFEKRDKSTVASFPTLNPEVLAKVYRNINEFYAVDKKAWLAQHPDDAKLESLVKSGNFPKLYAKELFETKVIIKTPEKPEDIEGDWFTYQLGDEDELAKTAEGTGWCIADPNVAHSYLEYGKYGHSRNKEADEESSSKAKQTLIKLDHKLQKGEDLTKEELSFLYELDRPIATLDTYNRKDPRITELKEKYGIEYALEKGIDVNELVSSLGPKDIIHNLDTLLRNGADINVNELVSSLDSYDIIHNLGTLLEYGVGIDVNELVSSLDSYDIVHNLDTLFKHGADVNNIVNNMSPDNIAYNLDTLLEHGADIDVNELVSSLGTNDIVHNLGTLLKHGADINNIINNIYPSNIAHNLGTLLKHGADINNIVSNMYSDDAIHNLDTLLEHGADINLITKKLKESDIKDNIKLLRKYGANLDAYQENN